MHLYFLVVLRKVAGGRLLGQAAHGAVAVSFAQKLVRVAVPAVPEHLARKTGSQLPGRMPSSGSGFKQKQGNNLECPTDLVHRFVQDDAGCW